MLLLFRLLLEKPKDEPPKPENISSDGGFNPVLQSGSYKSVRLIRRHLRRKRQQDILFLGN